MNSPKRTMKNNTKIKSAPMHPKQEANIISKIFFCWALPLFVKGFRKDLTEADLFGPLRAHESNRLGDKLETAWFSQIKKNGKKASLARALIHVFGKELALYGIIVVIVELIVKMSQPICIGKLMEYYTPHQTTITQKQAYFYASVIVFMSFMNVIMGHSYMLGVQHIGMKIRVACCSLIYRKSLRLSQSSLAETTIGQIVNLLSNDVNRFDLSVIHVHTIWAAPTGAILIMYLMYITVGPTGLAGLGILLLFIPLQLYLGKKTSSFRMKTAIKTDQRVRLMNEIISGIQVIKMYSWEKPFVKLVEIARKYEIQQIRASSYIRAINLSFTMFLNRTAIFLCIVVYVLSGNILHSQYVYVVTSFYGILRQTLTMFLPQAVTTFAETSVSIRRLQTFLEHEEVSSSTKVNSAETGVRLENVYVKWIASSPDYILNNLSLSAPPKKLVSIIGPVGGGKTTLLHVILKELSPQLGVVDVGGTISYASQESWIFGGTIRQNILFGQEMDTKRYKEVVKVCALERDFRLFPYGDRTMVGDRGSMLSGGQKARINLARAVYKEADIYLLDDPLSAVDAHVGKQLFEECITGYLKNKCTILVTHQLQYLGNVDTIYMLENGSVTASGSYKELKSMDNEYLKLLESEEPIKEEVVQEVLGEMVNVSSLKSLEKLDAPIEVKEHLGSGTISSKVYKSYMRAGGNFCYTLTLALLFLLAQVAGSASDYFLSYWVNLEQKRQETNESQVFNETVSENYIELLFTSSNCINIYSVLVGFIVVITLTRSLSFFAYCMNASITLHNNMFSKIVYTSMRFFNQNPSGRILNRFSKDMGSIDETLPIAILDTCQIGLIAFFITIVISIVNPWNIIATVVIFGLFYTLRVVFLATSRNLKRIEGTTRSPVFTHMTASLQGLTTIRAFNAENILRQEFDNYQDMHSSAFYMFLGCNRTFGFWLDLNCVIYIGLVTFSFLFFETETLGGNVGLGITQSITLTGMLQWGMRQWSELENQMTSVERVVEYTELPPEVDDGSKVPPKAWPSEGRIEFEAVSLRYDPEEAPVLKKLTFQVNAGEKIGIVGRTGAGKSSLISAFFRLSPTEGKILIDGVDTKEVSLAGLRSKISIIPQEPVLFSGTLRKNLDPFDEFDDLALWNALEEVELKAPISDMAMGLQSRVSEGGSNFSVGQRQLLCLARAVVRSNKILVLDEATANVDPQTDELIQSTIRRKFGDCTVLTIAHRLHTIMDSDKILVMDAGRAAEFDHPNELLKNTNSLFYGLVQETGKVMAENLIKIAEHVK